MPSYTPPLRDMQFVLHEVLDVVDALKALPAHADIDADTMNAVLEEGGKFAAEVLAPINRSGDEEGCTLKKAHEVHGGRTGSRRADAVVRGMASLAATRLRRKGLPQWSTSACSR